MPFRPVADALNSAAGYQAQDMFKYQPSTTAPTAAPVDPLRASAPPLGMPNKPIVGGTTMPVTTPLATMVQKVMPLSYSSPNVTPQNLQSSLYAQQQGVKAGLLPGNQNQVNLAGAVKNAQRTGYARSLWQPGGNKG